MKALVINSGSSSIKAALFQNGKALQKHVVEEVKNHDEALVEVLARLGGEDVDFVAHRVVHGGTLFTTPTRITQENLDRLKSLSFLAPLHNPHNVAAIEYFLHNHPAIPQIAVFDTAFFATLPKEAYRYAIEERFETKHHIRRFGFHGSSHAYLLKAASKLLGKNLHKTSLVTLHLGNGASACAIENGRSVDTSMGMTPLEGLVMGSRCGDIDAGAVVYMIKELGMGVDEVDETLNRHSGLKGLCGTNDMRQIVARKDAQAKEAFAIYTRRIKKYIGAYMALIDRVDAIVFSGGVGEKSAKVREAVLRGLEKFGILTDFEANRKNDAIISTKESFVKVFVIPTDEEMEIYQNAKEVVDGTIDYNA